MTEYTQSIIFNNQMAELNHFFDSFACKICFEYFNNNGNYPYIICQNFHLLCSECYSNIPKVQDVICCPFCKIIPTMKPIKYRHLLDVKQIAQKMLSTNLKSSQSYSQKNIDIRQKLNFYRSQLKDCSHKNTMFKIISEFQQNIDTLIHQLKEITTTLRNFEDQNERLTLENIRLRKVISQPAEKVQSNDSYCQTNQASTFTQQQFRDNLFRIMKENLKNLVKYQIKNAKDQK